MRRWLRWRKRRKALIGRKARAQQRKADRALLARSDRAFAANARVCSAVYGAVGAPWSALPFLCTLRQGHPGWHIAQTSGKPAAAWTVRDGVTAAVLI